MAFGYIPKKFLARGGVVNGVKEVVYSVIGWPHLVRRVQQRAVINMLELQRADIVLDIGCGGGEYAWEMARHANVWGLDIAFESLYPAASAKQARGVDTLAYGLADVEKLPVKDGGANKILVSGTLQSVDKNALFAELARVTATMGTVVIVVKSDHVLMRLLYGRGGRPRNGIAGIIRKMFSLPATYGACEAEYCRHVHMTRHYGPVDLKELAVEYGFSIDAFTMVPGQYASAVEDILHMVFWRRGFGFVKGWWFFLLGYPVYCFLDRLDRNHQKGNYLIARLIKIREIRALSPKRLAGESWG